jgi:prepilin-type N-terminal cleavage/methylation domain-containing protein
MNARHGSLSGTLQRVGGFTLIEVMIALIIFVGALALLNHYHTRTTEQEVATQTVKATMLMASKVRALFVQSGRIAGFGNHQMALSGFYAPPYLIEGSGAAKVINDPWGNILAVWVSPNDVLLRFAFVMDGKMAKEQCVAIVTSLLKNTKNIFFEMNPGEAGSAWVVNNGYVDMSALNKCGSPYASALNIDFALK